MNIVLWILSGVLAFLFFMAGAMKLFQGKEKILQAKPEQMGWANEFSDPQIRLIGLVELLGAIGLIAPQLTGILPILVPLAAIGLALDMGFAARVHARRTGEDQIQKVNYTILVLALIIAVGRFAGL